MNLRLFRTDDPSERETEALLAWYVNGTLDTSEHARVERHLTECLRCRRELQRLREFQAGMMQEVSVPALERALAGAHARSTSRERWRPRRWCSGSQRAGALRHRWCAARSPFSSFLSSVWASP